MKVKQERFYLFALIMNIFFLLLFGISGYWLEGLIIDMYMPYVSSLVIWLVALVCIIILTANKRKSVKHSSSLHTRNTFANYYPARLSRVLSTALIFATLLTGFGYELVEKIVIALIIAVVIPMPLMVLITTSITYNVLTLWQAVQVFLAQPVQAREGLLIDTLNTSPYFAAVLSIGLVLAVIMCVATNEQVYKSGYFFIVGIGTSLLSIVYIVLAACALALYESIWRHLNNYRKYLSFQHVQVVNAYEHYLENEGQAQLQSLTKGSWQSAKRYYKKRLSVIRNNPIGHQSITFKVYAGFYIFLNVAFNAIFRVIIILLMGTLHAIILYVAKVLYGVTKWLCYNADAKFRKKHHVHIVCDHCYHQDELPLYSCPNCAEKHYIVPGRFGVFKYRCGCGHTLPNTFKTGRNVLDAYCRKCNERYEHRESAPIIVPIIGDLGVGKTSLMLSSFETIRWGATYQNIPCDFATESKRQAFTALQSSTIIVSTQTTHPIPHTLHFVTNDKAPRRSVHTYDVTGRVFHNVETMKPLQYLSYADGYIFMLNALYLMNENTDLEDTLDRFIMYCQQETVDKVEDKINRPIAFVFNKIDQTSLKNMDSNTIKNWLMANDFAHLVRKIDINFADYQFFFTNSKKASDEQAPEKVYKWLINKSGKGLQIGGISK